MLVTHCVKVQGFGPNQPFYGVFLHESMIPLNCFCFSFQIHHLPQDRGGEEHAEPRVASLQNPRESSL